MKTADVVIVGGGVIGAAIAYAVARDGVDTLLIERGRLASEASEKSMEGLHWVHMTSDATLALAREGLLRYGSLAGELAERVPLRPIDFLGLVLDPAQLSQAAALTDRMRANGFPLDCLQPEDAAGVQPGIVWEGVCAALHGSIYHVDVPRLTRAYAAAARRHGARIEEGVSLQRARLNRSGDRVEMVETSSGPVSCAHLVVAAGAWTRRLLLGMGGPDLPVYHSHSQFVDAQADPDELGRLGLKSFIFGAGGVHARSSRECALPPAVNRWGGDDLEDIVPPEFDLGIAPLAGGGVRIGQYTRMVPGFYNRVAPEDERLMIDEAGRRFPGLQMIRNWEAGARAVAFTPDANPFVGFVDSPANVLVCSGFISPLILVPALADYVSQALQSRALPQALQAFSPQREPLL